MIELLNFENKKRIAETIRFVLHEIGMKKSYAIPLRITYPQRQDFFSPFCKIIDKTLVFR